MWIIIGHNSLKILQKWSDQWNLNVQWPYIDNILFEYDSSPQKFGGKFFVKQNSQKDILSYSSPRPSTTYLQAPKSTPDYFQAERSFSGNRQVISKNIFLSWTLITLFALLFSFVIVMWLLKLNESLWLSLCTVFILYVFIINGTYFVLKRGFNLLLYIMYCDKKISSDFWQEKLEKVYFQLFPDISLSWFPRFQIHHDGKDWFWQYLYCSLIDLLFNSLIHKHLFME